MARPELADTHPACYRRWCAGVYRLFSRHSASRPVSYQDEELATAVEQLHVRGPDQEWLIPVRSEECQIPERDIGDRPLASVHGADLFGPDEDIATIRLVVAVLRILDRQAGAARPDPLRHPAGIDPHRTQFSSPRSGDPASWPVRSARRCPEPAAFR